MCCFVLIFFLRLTLLNLDFMIANRNTLHVVNMFCMCGDELVTWSNQHQHWLHQTWTERRVCCLRELSVMSRSLARFTLHFHNFLPWLCIPGYLGLWKKLAKAGNRISSISYQGIGALGVLQHFIQV